MGQRCDDALTRRQTLKTLKTHPSPAGRQTHHHPTMDTTISPTISPPTYHSRTLFGWMCRGMVVVCGGERASFAPWTRHLPASLLDEVLPQHDLQLGLPADRRCITLLGTVAHLRRAVVRAVAKRSGSHVAGVRHSSSLSRIYICGEISAEPPTGSLSSNAVPLAACAHRALGRLEGGGWAKRSIFHIDISYLDMHEIVFYL